MKFTTLLSAVLVFTISAVNAVREEARLLFLPAPRIFPPMYRIRADLSSSRISYEIVMNTREPNWLAGYPTTSKGVIEFNELPDGRCHALINDNNSKGGDKTFTFDLERSGVKFHYEGTSVTDEQIEDLPADGYVRTIDDDDYYFYSRSRFYRNKDRYSYKNQQPMSPPCTK